MNKYREPITEYERDYMQPWQCELRNTAHDGVCIDPECELSGGTAHAGFCESCGCGKDHALVECPDNRNFDTAWWRAYRDYQKHRASMSADGG